MIIFAIICAALLIFTVAAAYMLYRTCCVQPAVGKRREYPYSELQKAGAEWFASMKPERVSVKTRDGLTLRGLLLSRPDALRTVIAVHGYRSRGMFDFSPIVRFYHEQKCNLLVVDQRACGESDGKHVCFGIKERFDLLEWIELVRSRFGELAIYLHGVSLGGATVLMAAALDLPANVKGIIDDCGYTSADAILRHVYKRWFRLPYFPLYYIAKAFVRRFAGFDPDAASAPDALRNTTLPVLIVHGGRDDFVPTEMSRENFAACRSEKKLIIVEPARHAESYTIEPLRLNGELIEFFGKHDK